MYIEYPKKFAKKLLKRMGDFRKAMVHKINKENQ